MTDGLKALCGILPDNTVMVEIGSHQGESARIFLESGKVQQITCVDPLSDQWAPDIVASTAWAGNDWEKCKEMIEAVLAPYPGSTLDRRPSAVVAINWPVQSLDFVYIDGLHTYESVVNDITVWLPKLKKGAIIGGHDYSAGFPGVNQAVNEIFGGPDQVFADSSWIKRVA